VKAKERKVVESLFHSLPPSRRLKALMEEFQRKGFLSRREMKILQSLSGKRVIAAA